VSGSRPSEVSLALALLHRRGLVEVDRAALALGSPCDEHLLDHAREVSRARLDRAGERVAAEAPEPHRLEAWLLAVHQRYAVVAHHDQHAIPVDDRPRLREIEGH